MKQKHLDLRKYGGVPLEYGMLKLDFPQYDSVKDKIDSLVQEGSLVRLKRGWYVVATTVSGQPYCKGAIANSLYGPSYVSLETALSYYGLIPEGVYATLSVNTKKAKAYTNEVGRFEYYKVPSEYYPIGITAAVQQDNQAFLIASPEKALCDLLYRLHGHRIQSKKAMHAFLFEDMRVDLSALESFDASVVRQIISLGFKKKVFSLLLEVLHDEYDH